MVGGPNFKTRLRGSVFFLDRLCALTGGSVLKLKFLGYFPFSPPIFFFPPLFIKVMSQSNESKLNFYVAHGTRTPNLQIRSPSPSTKLLRWVHFRNISQGNKISTTSGCSPCVVKVGFHYAT
uniref:Uncharacterized protein n=1 Tax=Cacopsylla melanoneura TaxID=428564 RepID=A0A8D9ATN5_9HEMI